MFDKIVIIYNQNDTTGSDLSCFKAELDLIAGQQGNQYPPFKDRKGVGQKCLTKW